MNNIAQFQWICSISYYNNCSVIFTLFPFFFSNFVNILISKIYVENMSGATLCFLNKDVSINYVSVSINLYLIYYLLELDNQLIRKHESSDIKMIQFILNAAWSTGRSSQKNKMRVDK